MRILFVSPYPPAKDGVGTYTQAVIAALRAQGHEAAVVVPRPQAASLGEVIGALSVRSADLRALRELVTKWNPDLIHVQFAVPAFATRTPALLSWLRLLRSPGQVPVVITMHEVTRDTAALRGPGRSLYRALAAQCDHVIVHTRAARSVLTDAIGVAAEKVSVIPHPRAKPPRTVSTAADLRSHFGLGNAELLVAFGFVHVDKGLDDLVRALCILRHAGDTQLDGVRLVIAGTVRPRNGIFRLFEARDRLHLARVLRMARRGKVDGMIARTGYVPEADVAGWFQAAAAIVLPYRRTEQSGVAGIADALGVPVLASTAGGLGEQYAGSPWTFAPHAPRELARVLARFLATQAQDRRVPPADASAADLSAVVAATLDAYRLTTPEPVIAGSGPDAAA